MLKIGCLLSKIKETGCSHGYKQGGKYLKE